MPVCARDGHYLWRHGTEASFAVHWIEPGVRAPDDLAGLMGLLTLPVRGRYTFLCRYPHH